MMMMMIKPNNIGINAFLLEQVYLAATLLTLSKWNDLVSLDFNSILFVSGLTYMKYTVEVILFVNILHGLLLFNSCLIWSKYFEWFTWRHMASCATPIIDVWCCIYILDVLERTIYNIIFIFGICTVNSQFVEEMIWPWDDLDLIIWRWEFLVAQYGWIN